MGNPSRRRSWEAFRGFRALGPIDSFRVFLNRIFDTFDQSHLTDTAGYSLPQDELNAAGAKMYAPTCARPFRLLMRSLPDAREGAFVDYGCGKGRALLMALEAGFPLVKGIEVSPQLLAAARDNLERVGCSTERFSLMKLDARFYDPIKEDRFFYFYDPFDDQTLIECLRRINASLDRHPRGVTIVMLHNLRDDWQPISSELGRFKPEIRRFAGEQFGIFRFYP